MRRVATTIRLRSSPRPVRHSPHVHEHEDGVIYVVEGEFAIWLDGETIHASAGATIHCICGVPHGFQNVGATPGNPLWNVIPGAQFETFFTVWSSVQSSLALLSVCSLNKAIWHNHWLKYLRIPRELVADQIACVMVDTKRPGIDLNNALSNRVAHCDLIRTIIFWKDLYLTLGRRFKTYIERDPVTQVGDAVDLLEQCSRQMVLPDLFVDRLRHCCG